jgi:hypothetical protein
VGLCTVNGTPVARARITMPRTGCWVADLVASQPVDASAGVTIVIEQGMTLKGSQARGGPWLDSGYLRILPGAGGMGTIARAKGYRNVSASVIIKDLLATAGEKLAPNSSSKVLATQFPFYVVQAAPVGDCLAALLMDTRIAAATWRSLIDGTVWVGTETWPDSGLMAPGDYQDISEAPHQGVADLGFEAPTLVPGVALEGRNVSAVEHNIDGERCRTKVWFEDPQSVADRMKAAIYAIARTAMPRLAYAAPRIARVITSATDGSGNTTLDVAPEDASFPTLQRVPLFHGEPGESITIATGVRVLVEFSAADPSKPFVRSWSGGESVVTRTISANNLNLGGAAATPTVVEAYRIAEAALHTAIAALATTAAGTSIDPAGIVFYGALATALTNFEVPATAVAYLSKNAKVQ